jgi:hypothetical protein
LICISDGEGFDGVVHWRWDWVAGVSDGLVLDEATAEVFGEEFVLDVDKSAGDIFWVDLSREEGDKEEKENRSGSKRVDVCKLKASLIEKLVELRLTSF